MRLQTGAAPGFADEIVVNLQQATQLSVTFPGITFESRTRHVGFGIVIDEARVQDLSQDNDEPATD